MTDTELLKQILEELKRASNPLREAQSSIGIFPVNDWIAIMPSEEDDPDKFIDDRALPPLKGVIVGVGPGTAVIRMQVELGQTVYYQRVANATLVPIRGDEILFMRQSDLIGRE